MLKTIIGKKVFVYNLSGTAVLFLKCSNILLVAILIVTAVKAS